MHPDHVTAAQLAELARLDTSVISRRRQNLPLGSVLHDHRNGRPPMCWSLDELAGFLADRTGHMTDIECRLRVALTSTPEDRRHA